MEDKRYFVELSVGIFMLIGILCLAYLSIKLGKMEVISSRGTLLCAKFTNVGGLKEGANVEIAGVEVGRVKKITLDKDYQAKVWMLIYPGVKIQEDAIAAVKTKGLIGEKYVEITPGGSDRILKSGECIQQTQPAFSLEDAIGKLIFGGPSSSSGSQEENLE